MMESAACHDRAEISLLLCSHKLSLAERKQVEDRAAEIIAEEMRLRDLRKAGKLTQACLAKKLWNHPGQRFKAGKTQRSVDFDAA
jgi:hypothetical protein